MASKMSSEEQKLIIRASLSEEETPWQLTPDILKVVRYAATELQHWC